MTALPFLLKDLDEEQRVRVLALDYVTACGSLSPEDWLPFAAVIEHYLRTGDMAMTTGSVHAFPKSVE